MSSKQWSRPREITRRNLSSLRLRFAIWFGYDSERMPTVLRESGFNFRIYTDDHEPSHVHVIKAGKEAVITLGSETIRPIVRENYGMNKRTCERHF